MGSSHFGELELGNGRSGSSRKGKKSSIHEKPKQPQRGLGVAQLEKIRLHNQMASFLPSLHHPLFQSNQNKEMAFSSSPSSSSYSTASSSSPFPLHPDAMMGFREVDQRTDIARPFLDHNNAFLLHNRGQHTVTLPLLEQNMQDVAQKKRRHDQCHSMGSLSQISDSSDTQELDLELKLSL